MGVDYNKLKFCFLLGIDRRSGTNYLFRLLRRHPQCLGPGPIWEDFFVYNSDIIRNYVDSVYNSWKPSWEIDKIIGPESVMLECLGNGLKEFLSLQLEKMEQTPAYEDLMLLSKTPSVIGLDNFFDIFPDSYLLILVRDGRAVVESGVRSFAWDYEEAAHRWARNAEIILDFKKKNKGKKFLVVRYEDIVTDNKKELCSIFNFLGLDHSLYNFDEAENLGVTGSSDLKKVEGKMHWKPVPKTKDFNPLARFKDWDQKRHERFNWIAGRHMGDLGYSIKPYRSGSYLLRNMLLDFIWKIKQYRRPGKH